MTQRPSILILTAGQLSRNPRVYKEACALGQAGYAVTVVRVANVPQFEAYDQSLTKAAPFANIIINHLGGSRMERGRAFRDRALTAIARRGCRHGWEFPHAFGAYQSLFEAAVRHPADLTIVHTEAPLCVGTRLLRRDRRVAADIEDWHSEDLLPEAQRHRPLALIRRTERDLMNHAAYASTTSRALASALQRTYGGRLPEVVMNCFPLPPIYSDGVGTPPSLLWFSQTVGPGRGLEAFVRGWSLLPTLVPLTLLGKCDPAYEHALRAMVPGDRQPALHFKPAIPPLELPAEIARHDIGLALEPTHPANKDLTISNKILQYLGGGLAVIASATAGQREVLERAGGAGVLVPNESPEGVVAALGDLVADPHRLREMKRCARAAASDIFCWERQVPVLVEAVAQATRGR